MLCWAPRPADDAVSEQRHAEHKGSLRGLHPQIVRGGARSGIQFATGGSAKPVAILDGRQPPDLTAEKLWRTSACRSAGKINGPSSALLERIRTQSSTEIAAPRQTTSHAASADIANRIR